MTIQNNSTVLLKKTTVQSCIDGQLQFNACSRYYADRTIQLAVQIRACFLHCHFLVCRLHKIASD